jgi:Phage terminase large subunit
MPTLELELEIRGAIRRLDEAIVGEALAPEVLVVGAAGTGKTWGILLALHLLSLARPGMRLLLCRKTRESLTESVLVTYEQEILPLTGHRWIAEGIKRRVRQSYLYPNGTEWIVGGLDKPSKIFSTSYDLAFVNEAIELAEEDWETLQSRIGRPERAHRLNALIGDTNPGDPACWLKRRCDEGRCLEWRSHHADNPGLHDGRSWTEAGRAYLDRLRRLTGTRRRRLFEGLWAAGEGVWFETFGDDHVRESAEFSRAHPLHLAVDSGVHTAAVWFQVVPGGVEPVIHVVGDYYAFGLPAYDAALAIGGRTAELFGAGVSPRVDRGVTDPAGKALTGIGPTVLGEYERAGLRLDEWPSYPGSVRDGLSLVESFVAVDPPALLVHPRCTHLITAFANYKRARRQGQYIDKPEDPQHPHEDLVDCLRGGLMDKFPEGRRPEPRFRRLPARSVF